MQLRNVEGSLRQPLETKAEREEEEENDVFYEAVTQTADVKTTEVVFAFERMNIGSDLLPGKLQPFMFYVEVFRDGKWYRTGCGFRTELGLFTAGHCLENDERIRFSTGTEIKEVPVDKVVELEGDVVMVSADYAPIGVAQAKVSKSPIYGKDTQMVSITNGVQLSLGPLSAAPSFGSVVYGGSTVAGFSGAPYYANKTVYGMHIGSGSYNVGYEMAYLHMLVLKREDSDRYFLDLIAKSDNVHFKHSPFDPDEIFIRTRHGYHPVNRELSLIHI